MKYKVVISQFEFPIAVENTAQIYALIDPRTNEIRYVGKSVDANRRVGKHMCDSVLRRYQDQRTCWLKSLKALGLVPSIVILETIPESEWAACERKWIAYFRAAGTRLTNTLDGGEGRSKGCKRRPESTELTASKLRGRKRPPEVGAKIREALARNPHKPSAGHMQKRAAGLARWWSEMTDHERTAKMQKVWLGNAARAQAKNTSGCIGVSWNKERNKWVATIQINRKLTSLGRFTNFEAAVAARKAAEASISVPV